MRFETTRNGAFIGAEYKSYRRFSADSTVRFDGDSAGTSVPVAAPAPHPASAPAAENVLTETPKSAPPEQPAADPPAAPAPPVVDAPVVAAQPTPPEQAAATAPTAPEPVFHASTQLVQVSVIAQDKDGKPVTDLRRDEFQIFDNAAPQEIRLFFGALTPSSAPPPQPPGTFTNRIAGGGSSVILLDKLFIDSDNNVFQYNVRARQKALLALNAIRPDERIAIYSLWCRFQVVREFTSDRDSLIEKLNAFAPASDSCANPAFPRSGVGGGLVAIMEAHKKEDFDMLAALRQTDLGESEFQAMADHLAAIPGARP